MGFGPTAIASLRAVGNLGETEDFVQGLKAILKDPQRFSSFRLALKAEAQKNCDTKLACENASQLHGHPAPCRGSLAGDPCGRGLSSIRSGLLGLSSREWADGWCSNCQKKRDVVRPPARPPTQLDMRVWCTRMSRIILRVHHSLGGDAVRAHYRGEEGEEAI